MQAPSSIELERPSLTGRLHELGRGAEDGETPVELGCTLAALAVLLALPFGLYYAVEALFHSLYTDWDRAASDLPWHDTAIYVAIVLGAAGTVLGTRFVNGLVRATYRRAYHSALTALQATILPVVVADDALRGLVRDLHEQSQLRKWTRPAYGGTIESQLQFASRYFYPLLSVARSRQPTASEIGEAEGCLGLPSWLTCIGTCALLVIPGLNLIGMPLALMYALFSVNGGLEQKARLAALCDFYSERESPWLTGWACLKHEWPMLRGEEAPGSWTGSAQIEPGPFDMGATIKRERERE